MARIKHCEYCGIPADYRLCDGCANESAERYIAAHRSNAPDTEEHIAGEAFDDKLEAYRNEY